MSQSYMMMQQIGITAASKIAGKCFTDVTLHHTNKEKTMDGKPNTITVRGKKTVIYKDLFSNGITFVLKSSSYPEEFMSTIFSIS